VAPDSLVTALPWYLYLLGLIWQSAHIVAHYILHIRYDDAGKPLVQTPVLFSKPSVESAAKLTVGLTIAIFIMSLILPVLTPLSYFYIIPVALYGIYTIYQCRAFLKTSLDNEKLHRAWSSLSLFRMVISAGILVSVLIYPEEANNQDKTITKY
jgi:heme O synthase-like polyprenyltransferase